MRARHRDAHRARARRLVRLGIDAVRPVRTTRSRTPTPSRTHFPADFICEAIDQTRGWFYSLLAVNTLVFDQTPYRNVVCLAHIVDQDGQKMSKSHGQHHRPVVGAARRRAPRRCAGTCSRRDQPWTPKRVSVDGIDEATRQFLLTLWNTYSFFVTYANLDGWKPTAATGDAAPARARARPLDPVADPAHGATVTDALEAFDALTGAQAPGRARRRPLELVRAPLTAPVLEVVRSRGARDALRVPLTVLRSSWRRSAPSWPTSCTATSRRPTARCTSPTGPRPTPAAIDDGLEAEMEIARTLVSLGRKARSDAKIGVRQPLPRAIALLGRESMLRPEVVHEIADELNVKRFEVVTSLEGLLSYRVVPNFARARPARRQVGDRASRPCSPTPTARSCTGRSTTAGHYDLDVDGRAVTLGPDDVEIRAEQHEELALAQDGALAVALDLTIDDDLRAEGQARELSRVLNDLRKARGSRSATASPFATPPTTASHRSIARHREWIMGEALATSLEPFDGPAPARHAPRSAGCRSRSNSTRSGPRRVVGLDL